MIHSGLHALQWGLPRLALVIGVLFLATLVAFAAVVFVLVGMQAITAFGQ